MSELMRNEQQRLQTEATEREKLSSQVVSQKAPRTRRRNEKAAEENPARAIVNMRENRSVFILSLTETWRTVQDTYSRALCAECNHHKRLQNHLTVRGDSKRLLFAVGLTISVSCEFRSIFPSQQAVGFLDTCCWCETLVRSLHLLLSI